MITRLSISLDEELADLIRREAKKSGRTVSEVLRDAIKAYQKERLRDAYTKFSKSKVAKELTEECEKAQLEVIRKLG